MELVTILILVDGFLQQKRLFWEVFPELSQSLFQQMVFCNRASGKKYTKNLKSQSLFQQMVFCNSYIIIILLVLHQVTILILVDGFLQYCSEWEYMGARIKSQSLFQQMVFCNIDELMNNNIVYDSHNPYFSRWFSAMKNLRNIIFH